LSDKADLQTLVSSLQTDRSASSQTLYDKDNELHFLQSELSGLMQEKGEKEQIIKTLTSENLKLGIELSESEQSARLCDILQKEIGYLNTQVESKDKQMHLT